MSKIEIPAPTNRSMDVAEKPIDLIYKCKTFYAIAALPQWKRAVGRNLALASQSWRRVSLRRELARWSCPKFLRQTFVEWTLQTRKYSFWAEAFYQMQRKKGKTHQEATER